MIKMHTKIYGKARGSFTNHSGMFRNAVIFNQRSDYNVFVNIQTKYFLNKKYFIIFIFRDLIYIQTYINIQNVIF